MIKKILISFFVIIWFLSFQNIWLAADLTPEEERLAQEEANAFQTQLEAENTSAKANSNQSNSDKNFENALNKEFEAQQKLDNLREQDPTNTEAINLAEQELKSASADADLKNASANAADDRADAANENLDDANQAVDNATDAADCESWKDDLSNHCFEIQTNKLAPGLTIWGGSTKEKIDVLLGDIIQKLMIALWSLSFLIMTIWAWFMIMYNGQDELLSKWKTIFMSWIISMLVALCSYYLVSLVRFILY